MRPIRWSSCGILIGFILCSSVLGTAKAQQLPRPVDQPGEIPSSLLRRSVTPPSSSKQIQLKGQVDNDSGSDVAAGTAQEPAMPSSQPEPATTPTETQSTSNTPNFLAGAVQDAQDLSNLRAGNFLNTKYRWYGFVRLDSIFDYNPIASTDDFVTSSIPVPQGRG